jgi:hypothetical protein
MRLQSSHSRADRRLDAYFTPPVATRALVAVERASIPRRIWEPAAGDGAIVKVLLERGYRVIASDIADYGCPDVEPGIDYLTALGRHRKIGIITNPPFRLAKEFAEKAVSEAVFVALLLRTNFLETISRLEFFRRHPPSRVWISSRRLPMMHRHGWTGPRSTSNTCHAWFVWDRRAGPGCRVGWFDWKDCK